MEAIKKTERPCVVLAGAGTGKTYTIVEKIKYISSNEIFQPGKIVCITFSNEATENIALRLSKSMNSKGKPIVRTFHGFSADLLRKYGKNIGINEKFEILNSDEAKVLLRTSFKISPRQCHEYISNISVVKDLGISFDVLEKYLNKIKEPYKNIDLNKKYEELFFQNQILPANEKESKKQISTELNQIKKIISLQSFLRIAKGYEKLKEQKGYQDYADLNHNALELIKNFPEIKKDFDYFIVDEFQDTNKIQIDILKELCEHRKITVVGDVNQSIYRFRGTYKKNLEEFIKHFGISKEEIFTLNLSRRSSNKILRAAHKLISKNYEDKNECFEVLNFEGIEGEKIEVYEMIDSKEEARKVVDLVERESKKGVPLEEICVLFRTHQQGRIIKNLLESKKIPFHSATKKSLFQSFYVKLILDFLNIVNSLKKEKKGSFQSWWDFFYFSDFSKKDLLELGCFMKENKENENFSLHFYENLEKLNLSDKGMSNVRILSKKINAILKIPENELTNIINESYKLFGFTDSEILKDEEFKSLNKFYELAKRHSKIYYPSLEGFLNYLETLNTLGIDIEINESKSEGVRLLTAHSTKGLEYDVVIVTNMAQKRFPMEKISKNPLIPLEVHPEFEDLEDIGELLENEIKNQLMEERRLAYVSFTRARKKLIFCYAKQYNGKNHSPSQFLVEMDYSNNADFHFEIDNEKKFESLELNSSSKINIYSLINSQRFNELLITKLKEIPSEIVSKKFEDTVLSPSSLLMFTECEKKYEHKYIYNMPDEKIIFWESVQLGKFVHRVLEEGVNAKCKNLDGFRSIADMMIEKNEWDSVDFNEAERMIKVFFERNKDKLSENSVTEQRLDCTMEGFNFLGYADRIDFNDDGIEIIDYKTNKSAVKSKHREWQLGYYALAYSKLGKVKKITLDMLNHDKSLEFELNSEGNAKPLNSLKINSFNIFEVKKEMVEQAKKLKKAYENGFSPCPIEKKCDFCNEYVYQI